MIFFLFLFFSVHSIAQTATRSGTVTTSPVRPSRRHRTVFAKQRRYLRFIGTLPHRDGRECRAGVQLGGLWLPGNPVVGKTVLDVVLVSDARNLNEVWSPMAFVKKPQTGYSATSVNRSNCRQQDDQFRNSLEGKSRP